MVSARPSPTRLLSFDALLLLVLVLVRARLDTFAIAIVPRPAEEVLRLPGARALLSDAAMKQIGDFLGDPLTVLVLAATFTLTTAYLVLDLFANAAFTTRAEEEAPTTERLVIPSAAKNPRPGRGFLAALGMTRPHWLLPTKLALLGLIIFLSVGLNTLMVIGLRVATEPHRFAHDGGVLMTEQAATWVRQGKNPYVEDFHGTAMEKAFPNGPGLSHYPYLPLAFLPTVPLVPLFQAATGWFDQRLIYLALHAITLVAVGFLVRPPGEKLLALMLVGLNPILANDLIYGYNDVFPLAFVALATLCLARRRHYLAALSLGVALATKLTVWPLVPFFLLAMGPPKRLPAPRLARYFGPRLLLLALPLLATALPFALANFPAFYDDVWLYNTGAAPIDPVPIKGWGLANLVLLWGWVPSTTSPFPFWLPQLIVGLPLLLGLLWVQRRHNSPGAALLTSGVFLLAFFLLSRTMNANYLGFTLSLLAIGYFADAGGAAAAPVAGVLPKLPTEG
jgi:hypothetical protein